MSLVEGKQPVPFDGYRFMALNAIQAFQQQHIRASFSTDLLEFNGEISFRGEHYVCPYVVGG